MNFKKIINLAIKIISCFLIVLSSFGIITFVFFRYSTLLSNPQICKLEGTFLGFFYIFSFGFLIQIIKKRRIGIYGYFVLSALGLIIGLIGKYTYLLSLSEFSLVFSIIILLLAFLNRKL